MFRLALLAANTLLRPQARRRFGISVILIGLSAILGILAFAFALAGIYFLLAEAFGPPVGALLTAAILIFVAICLLIAVNVMKRRTPPPPVIDPTGIAALGLLAGVMGVEALARRRKANKD